MESRGHRSRVELKDGWEGEPSVRTANLGMPSLTLVADVKAQASLASPACDLYLSRWFRLCRGYAEHRGEWRILSSQHGLLSPNTTVEPYELTKPRLAWYEDLVSALVDLTHAGDTLTLLSVARPGEALSQPLREAGRHLETPLEGLDLDRQAGWLEAQLQRDGVTVPGSRQRSDEEKRARRERRASRSEWRRRAIVRSW